MRDELGPLQIVADRLMTLYGDEGSLRRLLGMAKVDATRIPFDGRAANMAWFATLEAARQGKLGALVAVMVEEYPLDLWLVAIFEKIGNRS